MDDGSVRENKCLRSCDISIKRNANKMEVKKKRRELKTNRDSVIHILMLYDFIKI